MRVFKYVARVSAAIALVFTTGLTLGLWTIGDLNPTLAYLCGYGAAVIVKWAS